jgi:hypothetical protein
VLSTQFACAAHTRFIPLPGARQPTIRDRSASHHEATAHSPTQYATEELCATSATIGPPWNPPSRIPTKLPTSRFSRVKIPPKEHLSEAGNGLKPSDIDGADRGHGLPNPPIYIDLAEGSLLIRLP